MVASNLSCRRLCVARIQRRYATDISTAPAYPAGLPRHSDGGIQERPVHILKDGAGRVRMLGAS